MEGCVKPKNATVKERCMEFYKEKRVYKKWKYSVWKKMNQDIIGKIKFLRTLEGGRVCNCSRIKDRTRRMAMEVSGARKT